MSITYTYESNTMYLHTLKVHSNIDVTQVLSFFRTRCLLSYTYEGITMCLYKLQVHCTFDVTKVEHSCVIDGVFARCSLSHSTRCLLITLMKAVRCIS